MFNHVNYKKIVKILFLFLAAYFAGYGIAKFTDKSSNDVVQTSAEANWGLSFQQEGEPPVANATADYLKQYNAYYAQDTEGNVFTITSSPFLPIPQRSLPLCLS